MVQARLERATRPGPDLVTLWRAVGPLLGEIAPHTAPPCLFTVDPTSLLVTSHVQEDMPHIPAEWLGREYSEPDHNTMTEVLRSARGVGTLHEATGGRPEISRKYHEEMLPFGCDQELLVALRTRDGEPWGMLGLYREVGHDLFGQAEVETLRGLAPSLAEAVRHALLLGQALEPDLPDAPGVLLVDRDLEVTSATDQADVWLERLGGRAGSPPPGVLAVAGEVLRTGLPVVLRVLSRAGWVVVHGAPLHRRGAEADPVREVSVLLQPAEPGELAPLLMRAHGLTHREREVTELVLRGADTATVAARLVISEHTVQQHLKSIFDKTGVRSRRELVSAVFHRHYEPRVRDNEGRALDGRPARHGPMPGR
jgi:DNA-binding CsgD family transcriptional regulator